MPRAAKAKDVPVKKNAKKKNGYVMPEPIPLGSVIQDLSRSKWKIGPSIGCGGFGEIYSACKVDGDNLKKKENYDFVVKIEPHENGPLFVEMHFYMRNAKLEDINEFRKKHGLKTLGMPNLIGSGSHELQGLKHRFIVMPRYGRDIWSYFLENDKILPQHTIYRIAIQMLDVYHYIHEKTYVHGDLKGANILQGYGKNANSQVFLVDFGLATHYTTKDFKADPKKMHNGTIEYTSRDAHLGIPTMRGDFEILAYNIIHWSGVTLPWEQSKLLSDPSKVHKSKENFMSDINSSLKKLFTEGTPEPVKSFVKYTSELKYNEQPNYEKCKKIFLDGIKALGKSATGELELKYKKSTSTVAANKIKRDKSSDNKSEDDFETPLSPKQGKSAKNLVSPVKRLRARNVAPVVDNKSKKAKLTETSPSREDEVIYAKTSPRKKVISPARARVPPKGTSRKGQGATIVNANLTSSGIKNTAGPRKTYELDLDIDVSMDANVILHVNRLGHSPGNKKNSCESPMTPKVRVRRLNTVSRSKSRSPPKRKVTSSK